MSDPVCEEHRWARDVARGDVPAVIALLAVQDVHRAFGWRERPGALEIGALLFRTPACAGRYNRTWLLGLGCGTVEPKRAIGLCNLRGEDPEAVDLAYALAPAARGRRRMRAFVRLVLRQLFAGSTVQTVFAQAAADNPASRRTLEGLAFTPRSHLTFALARPAFMNDSAPRAAAVDLEAARAV